MSSAPLFQKNLQNRPSAPGDGAHVRALPPGLPALEEGPQQSGREEADRRQCHRVAAVRAAPQHPGGSARAGSADRDGRGGRGGPAPLDQVLPVPALGPAPGVRPVFAAQQERRGRGEPRRR